LIAFIGFWVIYEFFIKGEKKAPKPLDRSEVERKKFIERMKMNKALDFKWFFRGNQLIGKILYLKPTFIEIKKSEPQKLDILEMVVQPSLSSRLKLTNPLAKELCIQINKKNTDCGLNSFTNEIRIVEQITFDNLFGIFYDRTLETELAEHIKNDNIFRSDLENLASIYYVKSQEQSTFDPQYAHEMALKEKELQVELAKKRGKMTSI
jgi:hypothetical protein